MPLKVLSGLLCCCALFAQIPVRTNSASGTTAGTGTSATLSYTATSGHLLVAMCAAAAINLTELRITDGSNTWTKDQFIADYKPADNNGEGFSIYHVANATGGALTINCEADAPGGGLAHVLNGFFIAVLEYSGFPSTSVTGDGSNPVTAYSAGGSTSPLTSTLQTANANALLIGGYTTMSTSGSCDGAAGSGWTTIRHNANAATTPCAGIMEQIVSSTGNYTASVTVTSSPWVIGIYPFVPVASSPTILTLAETILTTNAGQWASATNISNGATGNLATFGQNEYACYINASSKPIIATVSLVTRTVTTTDPGLGTAPDGTDDHGACSIQLDRSGYIHLSYGTHVTPLNYYLSTNPLDASAFTGPLAMLGGTPETNVTFGMFFKNPANGELYYNFHFGAYNAGGQYFYHYNATSRTWEAPPGTTAGLFTNYTSADPFINALPQWDSNGVLWWSWITYGNVPACAVDCHNQEFIAGWNGTSWIKFGGAAQVSPITDANNTAVLTIGGGADQPNLGVLNGFAIDTAGVMYLPYKNTDASGFYQEYVAESSTGSFVSHQLTANSITWNPPNPLLWVSVTQSPGIIVSGTCAYVVWSDIFAQRTGTRLAKSCNDFSTNQTYYLSSYFNPNWILFPDSGLQSSSGAVSWLYMDANDPQLMFTYLNNFSTGLGKVAIHSWNPPGSISFGKIGP